MNLFAGGGGGGGGEGGTYLWSPFGVSRNVNLFTLQGGGGLIRGEIRYIHIMDAVMSLMTYFSAIVDTSFCFCL